MEKFIIEGTFVNYNKTFYSQVLCDKKTGIIEKVGKSLGKADKVFNKDILIFPGFGDIHTHAREDKSGNFCYKEDFISTGEAARNGGVGFIFDMPNNIIPPVCDKTYKEKDKLAEKSSIPIMLYAGIGIHTRPLSISVPYKAFLAYSIGDLHFHNMEEIENSIAKYREEHISFHCEDPYLINSNKNNPNHLSRRPREATNVAVSFAIYLIRKYHLKGKICHVSTKESLELIKAAKQRGIDIEVEVTPQHLFWDSSNIKDEEKPFLQINPPIRHKEDREGLFKSLKRWNY